MNEETNNTEEQMSDYYATERERLRAPRQLWQQMEAKMATDKAAEKPFVARRWPLVALPAIAAVALAIALLYVTGTFGSGDERTPVGRSARSVLASSYDAIFDPQRIGLNSYVGVADFTGQDDKGKSATSQIRVWYSAPDRYRFEVGLAGVSGPGYEFVANGGKLWAYDPSENTYAEATQADLYLTLFFLMPFTAMPPGLEPSTPSLETFLNQTETGGTQIRLAGEGHLLGRPVYIVELSPAWHESSISGTNQTPVETSGGVMRFWIDKETFFALKLHADMGKDEPPFDINFKSYQANAPVDDSLFDFKPPKGATKVDHDRFFYNSSGSSNEAIVTVEPITPAAIETPSP
jgi:outer membrane lipoprotein-sorting protein